jgi:acylphosphatase
MTDPAEAPGRSIRLEAVVRGRVQGVGYRYFVGDEAERLGLVGWVANEPDGSVRCVAEGPRRMLDQLEAALWVGPYAARVEAVSVTWSPAGVGFTGFTIRSRGHAGD